MNQLSFDYFRKNDAHRDVGRNPPGGQLLSEALPRSNLSKCSRTLSPTPRGECEIRPREPCRHDRQSAYTQSSGALFSRPINLPSDSINQEIKNVVTITENTRRIRETLSHSNQKINVHCDPCSRTGSSVGDIIIDENMRKASADEHSVGPNLNVETKQKVLQINSAVQFVRGPDSIIHHNPVENSDVDGIPSFINESRCRIPVERVIQREQSKASSPNSDQYIVTVVPGSLVSLLCLLRRYRKVASCETVVCGDESETIDGKENGVLDEEVHLVPPSAERDNSRIPFASAVTESANSHLVTKDQSFFSAESKFTTSVQLTTSPVSLDSASTGYWNILLSQCSTSCSIQSSFTTNASHEKMERRRQQEIEQAREESIWLCRNTQRDDFHDVLSFSCGLLRHLLILKEAPSFGGTLWRNATKNQRFGMIYHKAHRPSKRRGEIATISQLISVPFVSLQIFSSFVVQMSRKLFRSLDSSTFGTSKLVDSMLPTPKDDKALHREMMHDRERGQQGLHLFGMYFTAAERKVIIAACTLLAWKLADVDATVHIFQCDPKEKKMSSFCESSKRTTASVKPSVKPICRVRGDASNDGDEEDIQNESVLNRDDSTTVEEEENAFEQFRMSGIDLRDVIDMESYITNELSWRVGAAPLWWKVALEVVQIYFIEYLMKKSQADEMLIRKRLEAMQVELTNGERNVDSVHEEESSALRSLEGSIRSQQDIVIQMHSGLEQLMLGCVDVLLSCQAPNGVQGGVSTIITHTEDMKCEQDPHLREALVCNPLFGFALAVAFAKVPLEWLSSMAVFPHKDRVQFTDDIRCLIQKVLLWQQRSPISDAGESGMVSESLKE